MDGREQVGGSFDEDPSGNEDRNRRGIIMIKKIYGMEPVKRVIIVWLAFFIIQWAVFLVAYLTNPEAWVNVQTGVPDRGMDSALAILANNGILLILIVAANLFARFGSVSLGGLILIIQAVMIGWTAGTNGFAFPFPNLGAANMNYLKIGLWELSAYAIVGGVTLTKSLNISETFPPKSWVVSRKLKDITFDKTEERLLILAAVFLAVAALMEGFFI